MDEILLGWRKQTPSKCLCHVKEKSLSSSRKLADVNPLAKLHRSSSQQEDAAGAL